VPFRIETLLEIDWVNEKTRRILKADRELVIEKNMSLTWLQRRIENLAIYTAGDQRSTCYDPIGRLKQWTPPVI
jgi:hypothetical protein